MDALASVGGRAMCLYLNNSIHRHPPPWRLLEKRMNGRLSSSLHMFVYYVYLVLFSMKDVQSAASISTDIQHDDRLQEKGCLSFGGESVEDFDR